MLSTKIATSSTVRRDGEKNRTRDLWRGIKQMVYSVSIQRLIFLFLGMTSLTGMIGAIVLAAMSRAVPDSVIALSATAIGGLAGAANAMSLGGRLEHPELTRVQGERNKAHLDNNT